jgi:SAM-dependent methyltransferase
VLDVGAGTGIHTLALQERGLVVLSIDRAPKVVELLRLRGSRDSRIGDVFDSQGLGLFDTVFLIGEGAGMAGRLAKLPELIAACGRHAASGGQILIDSTDLVRVTGRTTDEAGGHIGERPLQLEYRGRRGVPYYELYTDYPTLASCARQVGWDAAPVWEDQRGSFVARLMRS